ncbi:MAG: transposase, partial [Bacteroidota bacterium]
DDQSGKSFSFITSNMRMNASTIALIYKKRWQIELLFKRLKQNYPLQYFLGDNENAIRIQIWCALIADLLVKVIKQELKRSWSFSNLVSMIRIHLMTYIDMLRFLEDPDNYLRKSTSQADGQLSIFDSS